MGAAEGTFDFDLELKKRSPLATILDKNSYTFDWIPKKTQRGSDRINQFQQKKLAEQLAIGMAVRNATLEQPIHKDCDKVKEEEIITVSAKAAGEEAAA